MESPSRRKTRTVYNTPGDAHELTFSCFRRREFLCKDRVIACSTLEHMVHYILNNPVRRGLVDDPAAWKWSSYNEWHSPGSGPLSLDLDSFLYL